MSSSNILSFCQKADTLDTRSHIKFVFPCYSVLNKFNMQKCLKKTTDSILLSFVRNLLYFFDSSKSRFTKNMIIYTSILQKRLIT